VPRLWLVCDVTAGFGTVPDLHRAPPVGRRLTFGAHEMSRYVTLALTVRDIEDVAHALQRLDIAVERGVDRVMLRGSLECAGEPVDLRVEPDAFDTIEDFGFVREGDTIRLVCGELDRGRLESSMLPALQAEVAALQVQRAAHASGVQTTVTLEPDGTRRIKLRR
jgi:hypothetical protein